MTPWPLLSPPPPTLPDNNLVPYTRYELPENTAMKTPNSAQELDAALRQGAQARRALLDEQVYPIGDYPPRRTNSSPARRGVGMVLRGAWTLGLSGGITAVLLIGLAGVLQLLPSADTSTNFAEAPQPPVLAESLRVLLAQIEETEQEIGQELEAPFNLVAAWPSQVQSLGETLNQPTALPAPIEREIAAIQHDLLAAADYVRQYWQASATPDSQPNSPESRFWPTKPTDSVPPTGNSPRTFGSDHTVASG